MGVESLKHSFAKNALAQWLSDSYEGYGYYDISPLSWKPNRENAGVWVEYPVCVDPDNNLVGLDPVWDENGVFRRARDYKGNLEEWDDGQESYIPTYDECIKNSLLPICIFDVAIQHKGNIIVGLEVVHRNPVSSLKKQYLQRLNQAGLPRLRVFEVDADWILNQVEKPKKLKLNQII